MNNFYVAIIQNDAIATLYAKNSYDEALTTYHSELAYRSTGRTSTKCAILNSELEVVKRESYIATTATETEGE